MPGDAVFPSRLLQAHHHALTASPSVASHPSPSRQIFQPLRRHLAFASTKPHFSPAEDYHRFSTEERRLPAGEDGEGDAIVVRTPILKRKSGIAENEVTSSTLDFCSPGSVKTPNSPFQTPSSKKGESNANNRTWVSKSNKFTPPAPASNSNMGSPLQATPSNCRDDSSLRLLTRGFIKFVEVSKGQGFGLKQCGRNSKVQVQKRRIYDITNILEGIGLIEKTIKNQICWKGIDSSGPQQLDADFSMLQEEIEKLSIEERRVDEQMRDMHERLRNLNKDESNQKWLFITEEDIKGVPCFQNETLIAIKAPHGTTVEVPDPDEAVDYPQRRHRIILRSTMGPVDVYLVSQVEEKFEDMNGVEPSPSLPQSGDATLNENAVDEPAIADTTGNQRETSMLAFQISPDANSMQECAAGIMRIVPPNVDDNIDFWLLSDGDVSVDIKILSS